MEEDDSVPIKFSEPLLTDKQRDIAREVVLSKKWVKKVLIPVVMGYHDVSIRIANWFVTNYAKEMKTVYHYTEGESSRMFQVFDEYKTTLRTLGRKLFDPFRRGPHVWFTVDGTEYDTTLGQLMFWEWASRYEVLDYIEKHLKDIQDHMSICEDRAREKKQKGKRKRSALSRAPKQKVRISMKKCTVCFDD
ncbi:MAG: hypothetical protein CMD33_08990 [Flavobacteriales bacterium]|nr:hypothetical protein [Flavobacteriales bacterium]